MLAASQFNDLAQVFAEHFAQGHDFASITQARTFAARHVGEPVHPGTTLAKDIDEAIESGVVRVAQAIVETASSPQEAFARLVALHDQQPALTVRSSTSVQQQAYSTPVPIAYLAAQMAGIEPDKTIYEPSAGHGALLLGADPGRVTVNELNPGRAADLRAQGYQVTEHDAANYQPAQQHDIVIANPPFGTVRDDTDTIRQFRLGDFRTSQIDQAIALQALAAMKPDGRAVLILGGKLGQDAAIRSEHYNTRESRGFFWTLYNQYNVTEHLSVWGDLYRKQGAGFPIDLILIEGQGRSARPLPAAEVPPIYTSFDELGSYLHDLTLHRSSDLGTRDGRTDSGRDRPREHQHVGAGNLFPVPGAAGGMADRALDGQSADGPGRNTPAPGAISATAVSVAATGAGQGNGSRQSVAGGMEPVAGDRERRAALPPEYNRGQFSRDGGAQSATPSMGAGDVQGDRSPAEPGGMVTGDSSDDPDVSPPKQVPYVPKSQAPSVNTLVPVNMETSIRAALDVLEQQVGPVDDYVADRLGYGARETLYRHFSAEQVDAVALAIANIEQGSGFVLGDQTGIGKGRVVAAMIRYAQQTGRTPVFVTKDTPLYADMVRDLQDIGVSGFTPFVTNNNLRLPLPDGRMLETDSDQHPRQLAAMNRAGDLHGFDGVFTTYAQMQTIKGQETDRRRFLRMIANGAILILDESHEAGGSGGDRDKKQQQTAPNRAEFTRELVELADGVLYSSATYAKRADVMDLYSRTDMRLAVSNADTLSGLVASGGVPMQQVLATMLTEAGQYCRRERSFAGVAFNPAVVPVNQDVAENISLIMAQIMAFDRSKKRSVEDMDRAMKAEAKKVLPDNSTGDAGVSSTNFTSIMHNVIDQMLFALKAEATVQQSLALLRQPEPEKPVIALSNTMGSFIGEYAGTHGLAVDQEFDGTFGDLLRRYLERSRDVMVGNPYGEKSRHRLSDGELGMDGVARYQTVLDLIAESALEDIPISPVDYITSRLRQEGFTVGEVTGREHIVQYAPDGSTTYARRSAKERSKATAVETVAAFNAGALDAIILNRSGSTGISLHASEKFADQRRRHMIVAQPEADINQFMQMLGRVHRTGQVVTPNFTLLMADIPAEKRPGAVLARKMASLNANTTAARKSGITLENIPDFMNEYGDQVVAELMMSRPDVHEKLDYPLVGIDGTLTDDNAIRRVTGRIPLLPLAEQEALYDLIEQRYRAFVAQQEALGESILEATSLDLDARLVSQMEVVSADAGGQTPFTGAVLMNVMDVKTPRKPYTTLQVINRIRESLALEPVNDVAAHDLVSGLATAKERAEITADQLEVQFRLYKGSLKAEKTTAIDRQYTHVQQLLADFPVGQPLRMVSDKGDVFFGVVGRVYRIAGHGGNSVGNPAAPSSWAMDLLLADPVQEITYPLSRINSGKDNGIQLVAQEFDAEGLETYRSFDEKQQDTREQRQIFTGNLLRAYEKFPGKLINFTDSEGAIHQGLMTRRGFDIEAELEQQPVPMPSVAAARRFLLEGQGELKTLDGLLTLKPAKSGGFMMTTPKAKGVGGQYFLDAGLLDAIGDEFYSIADRMECSFAGDRLDTVLRCLMEEKGWPLAAFEQREEARSLLGVSLPDFQPMKPPGKRQLVDDVDVQEPIPGLDYLAGEPSPRRPERPEQLVLALLQQGGVWETLQQDDDYHIKVSNEPFIPLVIERHSDQLYLTHYLSANGDTFIDSEMVFRLGPGHKLTLTETAIQFMGGESRSCDRDYARLFARNLLMQGFAEAMQEQLAQQQPALEPQISERPGPAGEETSDLAGQGAVQGAVEDLVPLEEQQLTLLDTADFAQQPPLVAPAAGNDNRAPPQEGKTGDDYPDLETVWNWGRAARDMNLPRETQVYINRLGRALKKGHQPDIPPHRQEQLHRDLQAYHRHEEYGSQVLDAARIILAQVGHHHVDGRVTFGGKIYELVCAGDAMMVTRREGKKVETILQASSDRIQRTTVTAEDAERFAAFRDRVQANAVQQHLAVTR